MKRYLATTAVILMTAQPALAAPVEQLLPMTIKTTLAAGKTHDFVFSLWDGPNVMANKLWEEGPASVRVRADQTIRHVLGSDTPFSEGVTGPVDFSQQMWVRATTGSRNFWLKLTAQPYALGGRIGSQGPQGEPGVPGNLALAGKACPANTYLSGFDIGGNLVCLPLSHLAPSCKDCHDGSVALAPNVMTHWAGSAPGQDGGHGDPDGFGAVECTACHDINLPVWPTEAQHGSGTYNSIWANDSTRSTNTAHLKAEFFTKYPANAAGDWSIQVAMDNYCTYECHDLDKDGVFDDPGEPANPMRHQEAPNAAGDYVIQFGRAVTPPAAYPNPDDIPDIPIDLDLNTRAAGGGNYAPCVSCHDPHGTSPTVAPVPRLQNSNRMMRFEYPTADDPSLRGVLCAKCHK